MFTFIFLFFLVFSSLEAQRVYKQSRVSNGTIITNYEYEYLPGSEEKKGKAYREGTKIKYDESAGKGRPYREGGKIIYR